MNDVDDDANCDAAAGGLGADQVRLLLGAVDEDEIRMECLEIAL